MPCRILTISWSRFNQIIKSRISLKSTSKGLLKNIPDEISRPLGSREIQKTKALPVLRDTLYDTGTTTANKLMGFDPSAIQSCIHLKPAKSLKIMLNLFTHI